MAKVKAISTPDRFLRRFVFKRNGPGKSRTSSRGFSAFWGRKSTQTSPSNGSTPNTRRSGSSRLLRSLSSFITKKRDHKIETNFCEESEPPATPSPVEEKVCCEDLDQDVTYCQPGPSVIHDDTLSSLSSIKSGDDVEQNMTEACSSELATMPPECESTTACVICDVPVISPVLKKKPMMKVTWKDEVDAKNAIIEIEKLSTEDIHEQRKPKCVSVVEHDKDQFILWKWIVSVSIVFVLLLLL